MALNVSLEEAYAEACKALGESIVRERLLTAEVDRLNDEATRGLRPPSHPREGGRSASSLTT